MAYSDLPLTTQRRRLTAYVKNQLAQVRGDYDTDPEHLNKATGAVEFAQKLGIVDATDVRVYTKRIEDADVLTKRHNGGKP